MLISEYLSSRNIAANISVPNVGAAETGERTGRTAPNEQSPFAEELKRQIEARRAQFHEVSPGELEQSSDVRFSKHAVERINERGIDMYSDNRLDRLNRAVELAGEKGSNDALVFIDSTAFLVSVRNNRVITTVSADDMRGNIFTNIDSTVIM